MKAAILGGGGLRVPLLAAALGESGLGFRTLALSDPDAGRLAAMAEVAQALAPGLTVLAAPDPGEAVRGSRFVVSAIRVGGQEARARDERAAIRAGALGQETVGAAGAALLFRNLPPSLEIARLVAREAPEALLINYTNPAGMVTEALANETGTPVVGVCDTPAEIAERAAGRLGAEPEEFAAGWSVGWSGINHLGWLTRLESPAADPLLPPEDRLPELLRDPEHLAAIQPFPLFGGDEFPGAIPSEYVWFALHPERAAAGLREAGTTRGEQILRLEARLFGTLGRRSGRSGTGSGPRSADAVAAYREVLAERGAGYFRAEATGVGDGAPGDGPSGGGSPGDGCAGGGCSGERAPGGRGSGGAAAGGGAPGGGSNGSDRAASGPSGYDRIGLAVIRAALGEGPGGAPGEIVLNARNRTEAGAPAAPELPTDDFVEVPCRMGPEGPTAIAQRPLPPAAGDLLRRVKAAEREFVAAALARDPARAAAALREHPAGGAEAAAVFPALRLE